MKDARQIAKQNVEILDKVEKILNIKLYDIQRDYILHDNVYWKGGRVSGKTTAYCIKLALSKGECLDLRTGKKPPADEYHKHSSYNSWFRNFFLEIWFKLKEAGLPVRDVRLK